VGVRGGYDDLLWRQQAAVEQLASSFTDPDHIWIEKTDTVDDDDGDCAVCIRYDNGFRKDRVVFTVGASIAIVTGKKYLLLRGDTGGRGTDAQRRVGVADVNKYKENKQQDRRHYHELIRTQTCAHSIRLTCFW